MSELPQPGAPLEDSEPSPQDPLTGIRPVIDVAEHSKALEPLLSLCYPARCTSDLHHLDEIQPTLEAAIKYDMARPMEELTARFLACAAQSQLQVWVFGCRHGLEHVARGGAEALRVSLAKGERARLSFLADIPPSLPALDGISAGQYFRLLQFICCVGGRSDAARAGGKDGTSTGTTHPRRSSDGAFALLRPPRVATARAPRAVGKRRVFLYLSLVYGEDGTWFEAHQSILSQHSPVFSTQIVTLNATHPSEPELEGSSAQSAEPAATLPVLELEGPSQAICALLCTCYPSQHDPHWSGLPDSRLGCIELLAVATKYQIKPATDLAATRWQALARIHPPNQGMHGVTMLRTAVAAAAAAAAALGWCPPLRTRLDECSRILEDLPARTYHLLFVYLDACVRAAVQALERATEAWELVAAERTRAAAGQPDAEAAARVNLYQAITNKLNRQRAAVERREVALGADHARALRWASYSVMVGPPSLRNRFKEDLEGLLASLPRDIEDAISEVKLDLG
ncbi:hypothetical protein V8D89_009762 [Ganoderma adspersum]